MSRLSYNGPAKLEVQLLSRKKMQVMSVGVEVGSEVGYRLLVGVRVPKTTTHINILYSNMIQTKPSLNIVDTVTKRLEVSHIKYLRTNMEMQSNEVNMAEPYCLVNDLFHIR